MWVTEEGMVTVASAVQESKAELSMLVTDEGMLTLVSPAQFWNV